MATGKERSIELIVEEQKRDYDYLLHIYNRMRATEGLLLTAAFGIVVYLYGGGSITEKTSLFDRLGVPHEAYGQVIYFAALGFFLYGTTKLMLNVFGKNPWMTAYEQPKTNYTYTALGVLQYVKDQYDECQQYNGGRYAKRKDELNILFYFILLSAIILIVIKTLG